MRFSPSFFLLLLVACLGLIAAPYSPACADDSSGVGRRVVRVPYFADGGYMIRSANGEYTGFNFEFLHEIAKYTGWKYEIVNTKSLANSLIMLEAGQIDLLPSIYYTAERTSRFAYSSLPMTTVYTMLSVRPDDSRYDYEDYDSFTGMTVGAIEDSLDGEHFRAYCSVHGINASVRTYSDTDALLDALNNKKIDGIAFAPLGRNTPLKSVARFFPQPMHIGVAPDQEELLSQLNNALEIIKIRESDYGEQLFNKYFSINSLQPLSFTKEEQAFIAQKGEITVTYDHAAAPLAYGDASTEAFSGVVADLFTLIAHNTGLRFRYLPVRDLDDAVQTLRQGTASVIACLPDDYLWTGKNDLRSTRHYLTAPVVRVDSGSEIETNIIALQRGYPPAAKIAAEHPDKQIRFFASPKECLDALVQGEADSAYLNSHIAEHLISDPEYAEFTVATLPNLTEELSIGVDEHADPRLLSILDKCLQYISDEQMKEIVLKHSIVSRSFSWRKVLSQHPLEIIGGTFLFFLIIVFLLAILLAMKSESSRRIKKLLYRDDLTGLYNLNKFRIDAQQSLLKNPKKAWAIVYTDIKQFRTINDTCGFSEGDRILRAFASILAASIASDELCARVSADQFVLLLHYDGWDKMTARTAKMNEALNDWTRSGGRHYRLIMVFGVYVAAAGEQRDVSLMLDFATYAKRSAGVPHISRTVRYDAAMREEGLLQRDLADRMQSALKAGEFIPYFQPKVDMPTGRLVGCEALARWVHPDKGILSPGAFIPFFEKNGFVVELDLYIYEQVCSIMRAWLDDGLPLLPVSCNFSRLHFKNPGFPEQLMSIADTYRIPYDKLELEVTESVFVGELDQVLTHFTILKKQGFRISIDDFGSGYSSLGLLQQFFVDIMKLDRTFIQEGMRGSRELAVVQGVIQLANALDMKVICEGVEAKEQIDALMSMGCSTAQGFYYAEPLPRSGYEVWLQRYAQEMAGKTA